MPSSTTPTRKLQFLKLALFISTTISLSFGLCGCKDPDVPPEPTVPQDTAFIAISSNVRNILDYDFGSYFVYRDSLTGKRDSQYVIQNDHYTQLGYLQGGQLYGRFERISTTFENGEGIRRQMYSPPIFNTDSLYNWGLSIILPNGQGQYSYDFIRLDWTVGKKWKYNTTYEITDHIETMFIQSNEFHDIFVIQHSVDDFYNADTVLNYYDPKIGLVKQKNRHGTKCLELVNYKILR